MKIKHVALWAKDIEKIKDFYVRYFNAKPNEKYVNPVKGFSSYFLTFDSGAQLEIMNTESIITDTDAKDKVLTGYAHVAVSVGSENEVDALTRRLAGDGYTVLDGPRRTGDGYYESVVLDPENNRIEITV